MEARVTWSWRSWGSVLKAMWPHWVECRQAVSVSSVCACETRVHVLPSWKQYPTAVFKIELSWTQLLLACPLHSLSWKSEHRRWAKCMFFFFFFSFFFIYLYMLRRFISAVSAGDHNSDEGFTQRAGSLSVWCSSSCHCLPLLWGRGLSTTVQEVSGSSHLTWILSLN